MKIYETIEIPAKPATTEERCVARSCDLCGLKAKGGDEWGRGFYEVEDTQVEVTIRCERGTSYPEERDTTLYEIDICPDCFVTKLIPWINSERPGQPPIKGKEINW